MSTTVQQIYDVICTTLLEDGGLVLGIVTPAQFLGYLEEAVLSFCQESGLTKKIYSQQVQSGIYEYQVPDDILLVQACFIGGVFIQPTSLNELQNGEYEWAKQIGQPRAWLEEGLPASTLRLFPIPDFTGSEMNNPSATPPYGEYGTFATDKNALTIVGTAGPDSNTFTLGDPIPSQIPDSFTAYLTYFILERIASTDGEARDSQRAFYCGARWKEGLNLASSIAIESMAEDKK